MSAESQPLEPIPIVDSAPFEVPPADTPMAARQSLGRKAVVATTMAAMYGWSHTGYVLEVAGGKGLEHLGANPWLAAATVAGVTAAESLGMSYVATAGVGDFVIEPKNKVTKAIAASAVLSPIQSLWSGAPAGVMTDKMFGREVTMKRRMVHVAPYAAAVGFWVTPTSVAETVTGTITSVAETAGTFAIHEAEQHPTGASALVGALALAAIGAKLHRRRSS